MSRRDKQNKIISGKTGIILYPGTARWLHIHNCSVHCIHTMLLSRAEYEYKMSVYYSYLQIFWSAQNLCIHRSMHHHNVMYILLSPGAICSVRNGVSCSAMFNICGEQKQESFDFLFMSTRLYIITGH